MKNKLAIFDLDGTLFDTNEVNYLSYKQALQQHEYTLDYEFYVKECNGKYYKEYLPKIIDSPSIELMEAIHNSKKDLYNSNLSAARVNEHLFSIIEGLNESYYVAVVTTASNKNCYDILKHFEKKELFDLIITHNDVKKVKPDPEGFLKAMSFFNISAENTIIFEDSEVGIEAALRSGAVVFTVAQF
ncbi:HAD-superfamily hydrolase [Paenibacillus sp. FSL R7-269]|uniref:HAD family hydrolase n=1 Tax=Paenibacillus sp. FSL R7-269 TaxID=1226755 RepID=UPI0003E20422|nr:HAD family phosphatase [Paenibacillus sp. FSL R7-269]ETT50052.1 HAD-superfamily hydrolase [Paenibacillus sp. FSL R7-269]